MTAPTSCSWLRPARLGARDASCGPCRPGRSGRIHVLPAVPPDVLAAWVASADVGLMPNQPRTLNERLSTPNKLFECLAVGLPVVSSDFPERRRIVIDDPDGPLGTVCDPTDSSALAAAIGSILDLDPASRSDLRARCLKAAHERWNWETGVGTAARPVPVAARGTRGGVSTTPVRQRATPGPAVQRRVRLPDLPHRELPRGTWARGQGPRSSRAGAADDRGPSRRLSHPACPRRCRRRPAASGGPAPRVPPPPRDPTGAPSRVSPGATRPRPLVLPGHGPARCPACAAPSPVFAGSPPLRSSCAPSSARAASSTPAPTSITRWPTWGSRSPSTWPGGIWVPGPCTTP